MGELPEFDDANVRVIVRRRGDASRRVLRHSPGHRCASAQLRCVAASRVAFLLAAVVVLVSLLIGGATAASTGSTSTTIDATGLSNGTFQVRCDANPAATQQTVTLVDGKAQDPRGPDYGTVSLGSVQRFDATGDGKADTVVELTCLAGANAHTGNVVVMVDAAEGPHQVATLVGQRPGPDSSVTGQLVVWVPAPTPTDPRCCPTGYRREVYAYRTGAFQLVSSEPRLASDYESAATTTTTPSTPIPPRRHRRTANPARRQTTAVPRGPNVTIATGQNLACALYKAGTVKCWGALISGSTATPTAISGLTNVTSLAVGSDAVCATLRDGTVECFGKNNFEQLGNGSTSDSAVPVKVTGVTHATAVTGGGGFACALIDNGTVTCWGLNDAGQLGDSSAFETVGPDGSVRAQHSPVAVPGIADAVAISASTELANGSGGGVCALLADKTVSCWGALHPGASEDRNESPQPVDGITGGTEVSAGANHACALVSGVVKCWGKNESEQLGSATPTNFPTGVLTVSQLNNVKSIAAGSYFTCALLGNGKVSCWGSAELGELGSRVTTQAPRGVEKATPDPVTVPLSGPADGIEASDGYACATLRSGGAECWGANTSNVLGRPRTPSGYSNLDPGIVEGL